MSKGAQTRLVPSKTLTEKNPYVKAIYTEYADYVLDEEDCLLFKAQWRKKWHPSLKDQGALVSSSPKLNLEIGPGAGDFFASNALENKNDLFIAIELKYKPLIQTAHKIKAKGCLNAKVIRYNARMLKDVFALKELDNVYIHFPDPWPKTRHHKHRLIKPEFLKELYPLQKKGSFVEVKTDHLLYFKEIKEVFEKSPYQQKAYSEDLHKTPHLVDQNFVTAFEKIFIRKNQAIYYLKYTVPLYRNTPLSK